MLIRRRSVFEIISSFGRQKCQLTFDCRDCHRCVYAHALWAQGKLSCYNSWPDVLHVLFARISVFTCPRWREKFCTRCKCSLFAPIGIWNELERSHERTPHRSPTTAWSAIGFAMNDDYLAGVIKQPGHTNCSEHIKINAALRCPKVKKRTWEKAQSGKFICR